VETCLRRGKLVYGGGGLCTEGRLVYRGETCLQRGETCLQRERLVCGGKDSSTEGEARLQRGRLFYRGRDSSAEGYTRIQRGRLVYGGGDSSTEGRLVYGWGNSSTEIETRRGTECALFSFLLLFVKLVLLITFFWCIFLQLFQRIRNQREILRFFMFFDFFAKKFCLGYFGTF
jgi:hypothetical protein